MIRNGISSHMYLPSWLRKFISLHGSEAETVHDFLNICVEGNQSCDDVSMSSRSTIQSGELEFSDVGDLIRPNEEQEAERPPDITLDDLVDLSQTRSEYLVIWSTYLMRFRTAEGADLEEALSQTYKSMTSGYLGHAGWIGIPPLHHQTELSTPYTEDSFPDDDIKSAVAIPSPSSSRRPRRSMILESPTRKAEMAL
jgi:hypothetical protein